MLDKKISTHIIVLIISTICILFGTNIHFFSLISFALIVVYLWYADEATTLSVLLYLLPLAMIFKFNTRGTSFFTYIEICVVIFLFIKNYQCVNSTVLVYVLLFSIYIIGTQLLNSGINITMTLKIMAGFFVLIILTDIDVEASYRGMFFHFIIGLIVSSFFAYFLDGIFHISSYFEVQDVIIINGDTINRFSGLYSDPNYYAINILIAFCLIIVLFNTNNISPIFAVTLSFILVFFASKTQSKSALFSLAIPSFFIIYSFYKTHNTKMLLLSTLLVTLFIILLLNDRIPMFANIMHRIRSSSGADSLTTGRSTLWVEYVRYIIKKPIVLILGRSILFYRIEGMLAPHNTYIDMIYQLGMVGTVLLFSLISAISSRIERIQRVNYLNYSVLACMTIMYFCISELQSYETPFHILMCIMVMHIQVSTFEKE